ncbi:MAG TPA: MmgE/PrpD family protein [Solirubrobacteraceae bacterium]|nr:MmgE/PrpD family protein [Solirubrobacteraceae bacterium]
MTGRPLSATVAAFARSVFTDGAPEHAMRMTRRVALDQVGLQIGCAHLPWSLVARDYARASARDGSATVLVHGDRLTPEGAAFANAAFGHGQDFDDTCRPAQTHAGAVVVPTAVAVGEEVGATGEQVARAIAAGLEVMLRVAHMVSPECLRRGNHPMLVGGPFGAATAAGLLLGLDEARLVHALGIAGSYPGGLVEYSESGGSVKRLHGAIPTTAGIRAAAMAKLGLTGPTAVFEGAKGVGRAFAGEPALDRLTRGLGTTWLLDDLAFKFYNCCYFIHPAIDAVLELQQRHGLQAHDVAELRVGTSRQGLVHVGQIPEPADEVGAQFSMHFTLALTLLGEVPGLDTYSAACLGDPGIRALARRVVVEEDATATSEYPANWGSVVTARTHDGRDLAARVRDPRGTRENPCTDSDLHAKFDRNVEPVLGAATAAELRERLDRLDELPAMAELTAAAARTTAAAHPDEQEERVASPA